MNTKTTNTAITPEQFMKSGIIYGRVLESLQGENTPAIIAKADPVAVNQAFCQNSPSIPVLLRQLADQAERGELAGLHLLAIEKDNDAAMRSTRVSVGGMAETVLAKTLFELGVINLNRFADGLDEEATDTAA